MLLAFQMVGTTVCGLIYLSTGDSSWLFVTGLWAFGALAAVLLAAATAGFSTAGALAAALLAAGAVRGPDVTVTGLISGSPGTDTGAALLPVLMVREV